MADDRLAPRQSTSSSTPNAQRDLLNELFGGEEDDPVQQSAWPLSELTASFGPKPATPTSDAQLRPGSFEVRPPASSEPSPNMSFGAISSAARSRQSDHLSLSATFSLPDRDHRASLPAGDLAFSRLGSAPLSHSAPNLMEGRSVEPTSPNPLRFATRFGQSSASRAPKLSRGSDDAEGDELHWSSSQQGGEDVSATSNAVGHTERTEMHTFGASLGSRASGVETQDSFIEGQFEPFQWYTLEDLSNSGFMKVVSFYHAWAFTLALVVLGGIACNTFLNIFIDFNQRSMDQPEAGFQNTFKSYCIVIYLCVKSLMLVIFFAGTMQRGCWLLTDSVQNDMFRSYRQTLCFEGPGPGTFRQPAYEVMLYDEESQVKVYKAVNSRTGYVERTITISDRNKNPRVVLPAGYQLLAAEAMKDRDFEDLQEPFVYPAKLKFRVNSRPTGFKDVTGCGKIRVTMDFMCQVAIYASLDLYPFMAALVSTNFSDLEDFTWLSEFVSKTVLCCIGHIGIYYIWSTVMDYVWKATSMLNLARLVGCRCCGRVIKPPMEEGGFLGWTSRSPRSADPSTLDSSTTSLGERTSTIRSLTRHRFASEGSNAANSVSPRSIPTTGRRGSLDSNDGRAAPTMSLRNLYPLQEGQALSSTLTEDIVALHKEEGDTSPRSDSVVPARSGRVHTEASRSRRGQRLARLALLEEQVENTIGLIDPAIRRKTKEARADDFLNLCVGLRSVLSFPATGWLLLTAAALLTVVVSVLVTNPDWRAKYQATYIACGICAIILVIVLLRFRCKAGRKVVSHFMSMVRQEEPPSSKSMQLYALWFRVNCGFYPATVFTRQLTILLLSVAVCIIGDKTHDRASKDALITVAVVLFVWSVIVIVMCCCLREHVWKMAIAQSVVFSLVAIISAGVANQTVNLAGIPDDAATYKFPGWLQMILLLAMTQVGMSRFATFHAHSFFSYLFLFIVIMTAAVTFVSVQGAGSDWPAPDLEWCQANNSSNNSSDNGMYLGAWSQSAFMYTSTTTTVCTDFVFPLQGHTQYTFCSLSWPMGRNQTHNDTLSDQCADTVLTVADFAHLSRVPYYMENPWKVNAMLKHYFPGWTIYRWKKYTDPMRNSLLHLRRGNTDVITVRGTYSAAEALQDLNLWMPAGFLQLARIIGPSLFSLRSILELINFGVTPYRQSQWKGLYNYVKEAKTNATQAKRMLYLTGHSLGGGLAAAVGGSLRIRAVTFSAPGLGATSIMLDPPTGGPKASDLRHYVANVMPAGDIVPMVDTQVGDILGIDCTLSASECHGLQNTVCEIMAACGDGAGRGIARNYRRSCAVCAMENQSQATRKCDRALGNPRRRRRVSRRRNHRHRENALEEEAI